MVYAGAMRLSLDLAGPARRGDKGSAEREHVCMNPGVQRQLFCKLGSKMARLTRGVAAPMLPAMRANDSSAELWLRGHILRDLLVDAAAARVAVVGDFCLDVYWHIDPSRAEQSIETGLVTNPVRVQQLSPGGAGNVAANLLAAGCRTVYAVGVTGSDPWGRELRLLLAARGADTEHLLTQEDNWSTLAYVKPYIGAAESPRVDFGNFNVLADETATLLLDRLAGLLDRVDVVIVNEQVQTGVHSPLFRQGLAGLIARRPETVFLLDSRHYTGDYPGAWLKMNAHEAVRLCGRPVPSEMRVSRDEALQAVEAIFNRFQKPVFVTRGPRGLMVRDESGLHEIPGTQVLGRTDTVGAGDSTLAGIALAVAAGRPPVVAAQLGNFMATVTIQKIGETGTATPEEILAVGESPDYIYEPELADDPRHARRLPNTEFEVVTSVPAGFRATHAIFDHDGTISTLREGWEKVMEPMMIREILGPAFESADESVYAEVTRRVREYIDRSTGYQTLVQMRALADMVREFGFVPPDRILDEHGYKAIYNDALMEVVNERLGKLRRGELIVEDFVLKNAVRLLQQLRAAGVRLYLASGTDETDVMAEARALGYAELFEGRIYGAVGDIRKEAKKIVLDRIMEDIGPAAMRALVTFGDGPVEIRETRKRGGLAIGVASDEVRRFGWNPSKRARLIRAGADLLVPDFSQLDALLRLLGVGR